MNNSFFSFGYSILWRLIRPFLQHHKRLRKGFEQRLVPYNWSDSADVWIQAASGGEAYLVRTLLEHIPLQNRSLRFLLTTWTEQGQIVLEEAKNYLLTIRQDINIQVQFVPLDDPYLMEKALEQVKPKVVVLLETELWPGLLIACSKKNIPVLILNGRIRESSLRGYDWISWFFPKFWRSVAPWYIAAISSDDAVRFSALFGEYNVGLIPNIKFDRTTPKVISREVSKVELSCDKELLVLASVREEEEALLVPMIKRLYIRWKDKICIVIAPRHMHRVKAWTERLNSVKLPFKKRSELVSLSLENIADIIIWDKFGELEQLYSLAKSVFVGGSLAPLGGQNFLEPLSMGKVPCVGQHLDNFLWVFEPVLAEEEDVSLSSLSLINICFSVRELEASLEAQIKNTQSTQDVLSRFTMWLEPRKGGVDKSIALLMNFLE